MYLYLGIVQYSNFKPSVKKTKWKSIIFYNCSDEVDGLGSVSVWCGGMDIKEIG